MITYVSEVPYVPCKTGDMNFLKKYSARRALMELGENDAKLNLRMAENLLTISAENFKRKWNFDTMNMKPLPGRFVWTPFGSQNREKQEKAQQKEKEDRENTNKQQRCCRIPDLSEVEAKPTKEKVGTCLTVPTCGPKRSSSSDGSTVGNNTTAALENSSSSKSSSSFSSTKLANLRQTKITDFGRQRKRRFSASKSEEEEIVSPRKKIHLQPSK